MEVPSLMLDRKETRGLDPVAIAERRELLETLSEAISQLSDREKLVLSLYYKEELTLREIAQVLGVSVTRAHQLRRRALLRLRGRVRPPRIEKKQFGTEWSGH